MIFLESNSVDVLNQLYIFPSFLLSVKVLCISLSISLAVLLNHPPRLHGFYFYYNDEDFAVFDCKEFVEGRCVSVICIADMVKSEAALAVWALQKMNTRVVLLTGDNARTAEATAKQVGIKEVFAEVLPNQKQLKIEQLQVSESISDLFLKDYFMIVFLRYLSLRNKALYFLGERPSTIEV